MKKYAHHNRKKYIPVRVSAVAAAIFVLLSYILIQFVPDKVRATGGTYTSGLTISQPGIYENLDVTNPGGFCVKITASNVVLKNSKIHDCHGYGIWVESAHDVQIIGNEVKNTVLNSCYPNCTGGWESALKVRSANETDKLAYNILFEQNTVHDNLGEGIAARGSHVTIRNNVFYDNFSVNIYSNGDHTTTEKNLVYCTGAARYMRDGYPPAGIAQGDESYTGWNPSHARNEKIINNIVTGCKYGFTYIGAESGVEQPGFKDSVVAYNTFACTTNASVRIVYAASQGNVTIANNIGGTKLTKIDNMSGITLAGNLTKLFTCGNYSPDTFRLTEPLAATGNYSVGEDYAGTVRTAPMDAGAFEYGATGAVTTTTPTPTPTPGTTVTPTPSPLACPPANYTGLGIAATTVTLANPGNYKVWIQMNGKGDGANTVWLQLDGLYCVKAGDLAGMPANIWTWIDYENGNSADKIPMPILAAGTHTIRIIGNSAEPGVQIDRILLTRDTTCVPTGNGDACIGVVATATPTMLPTSTATPSPTTSPTPIPSSTPGSSAITYPSDDAYVDASQATKNHGNSSKLKVDGSPSAIAYLKFDFSSFSGKSLQKAVLRMRIRNSSTDYQSLWSITDTAWSEKTVTYQSRPSTTSTPIATIHGGKSGTWLEIDITPAIQSKLGTIAAFMMSSQGSDGFDFYAKETSTASDRPSVILTWQ